MSICEWYMPNYYLDIYAINPYIVSLLAVGDGEC